jgi:hypothetical protein
MGQIHPTGLTPNLLKLFEPRPPLEYKPPLEKHKLPAYTGMFRAIGDLFLSFFFFQRGDIQLADLRTDLLMDGYCRCCSVAGMAQFVSHFAEPGDPEYAPPVPKCETRVDSFGCCCCKVSVRFGKILLYLVLWILNNFCGAVYASFMQTNMIVLFFANLDEV